MLVYGPFVKAHNAGIRVLAGKVGVGSGDFLFSSIYWYT